MRGPDLVLTYLLTYLLMVQVDDEAVHCLQCPVAEVVETYTAEHGQVI